MPPWSARELKDAIVARTAVETGMNVLGGELRKQLRLALDWIDRQHSALVEAGENAQLKQRVRALQDQVNMLEAEKSGVEKQLLESYENRNREIQAALARHDRSQITNASVAQLLALQEDHKRLRDKLGVGLYDWSMTDGLPWWETHPGLSRTSGGK